MVSLHRPNTILRRDINRNNLSSNHNQTLQRLVNTPTPTQKIVIQTHKPSGRDEARGLKVEASLNRILNVPS